MTTKESEVDVLANRLREMADNAYCDYVRQLSAPECQGWEAKTSGGKFGWSELSAHKLAQEQLGRHRALSEAAAMVTALRNAGVKS